ncbi:hypothetical protein L226DRAFT_577105 [Lentinus tigrinus ALCF2SS1-7]|uniref:F-box domain-containing protein n=1 Tax=Lentinus tigrinus ALCF2SS1-6 TaxID=1328759 RepID=A0A5C2SB17_9APHY|nr:hypothetical protein L227DRAFT_611279 [Lentinus tigrinus ALCF2SS1-6]RPD67613.1 hypothetical protein L226DRAFT_577105 [Lentinus tigrinus ALCF2SS1-7]
MVSTRSQRKAQLAATVSTTPLVELKIFQDLESIISFTEVATVQPEHGAAIHELAFFLNISSLQREILERTLSICLSLTPNVEILTLWIYPPISVATFASIPLPRLEVFRSSLPHRALLPFVATRPALRALDLGSCGRARTCTLSTLSLQHINDLTCRTSCAPRLVHQHLDRLRLVMNDFGGNPLTSAVISSFPVAMHHLQILTVEFTAADLSILRVIAIHIPALRNLKMLERFKANKHAPRAWDDRTGWSSALRKLSQLEQLVIRTDGAVAHAAGDHIAEREAFRKWVGGARPHPTLRYIAVWQRCRADNYGVISEWSREDGIWTGKWSDGVNGVDGSYEVFA